MADKKKKGKRGAKRIPSEVPTVLIAPSDYEHIYSANKKQPQTQAQPQPERATSAQVVKRQPSPPQAVKRVPSDVPTVLIAPSDYQHIYSANKKAPQTTQTTTAAQQVKRDTADRPSPLPQANQQQTPGVQTRRQHRPTSPPPDRQQDNVLPQSVIDSVERFIRRQPKKYTL